MKRLKQKELKKQRFAMDKAKAAENGMEHFTFDGAVHPTNVDLKKQEQEKKDIKDRNPQAI